eukprot:3726740-Alexandrium_andersonii.AAC.1
MAKPVDLSRPRARQPDMGVVDRVGSVGTGDVEGQGGRLHREFESSTVGSNGAAFRSARYRSPPNPRSQDS